MPPKAEELIPAHAPRLGEPFSLRELAVGRIVENRDTGKFGNRFFEQLQPFPPSSVERFVMPVTLPPGRARLSTRPASTGSAPAHHNDRNRLGRIHGRPDQRVPSCYHDDIDLETHQLGRKLREPIELPLSISVLDGDVLSFYVTKLAQSQPNCLGTGGSLAESADDRYPIRGIFFGCCASADEQSAKSKMLMRKTKNIFSFIDYSVLFADT